MELVRILLLVLTSICVTINGQNESNNTLIPELHYVRLHVGYSDSVLQIFDKRIPEILADYGLVLVRCYLNISENDGQSQDFIVTMSDVVAVEIRTLNISILMTNYSVFFEPSMPTMVQFPFYLVHNGSLVPSTFAINIFESNCGEDKWEDMFTGALSAFATFSTFAEGYSPIQSSSAMPTSTSSMLSSFYTATPSSDVSSLPQSDISIVPTSATAVEPPSQVSPPVTTSLLQDTPSSGLSATYSVETTIHSTVDSSTVSLPIQSSLPSIVSVPMQTLQPSIGVISTTSSIHPTITTSFQPTPSTPAILPTPSLSLQSKFSSSALGPLPTILSSEPRIPQSPSSLTNTQLITPDFTSNIISPTPLSLMTQPGTTSTSFQDPDFPPGLFELTQNIRQSFSPPINIRTTMDSTFMSILPTPFPSSVPARSTPLSIARMILPTQSQRSFIISPSITSDSLASTNLTSSIALQVSSRILIEQPSTAIIDTGIPIQSSSQPLFPSISSTISSSLTRSPVTVQRSVSPVPLLPTPSSISSLSSVGGVVTALPQSQISTTLRQAISTRPVPSVVSLPLSVPTSSFVSPSSVLLSSRTQLQSITLASVNIFPSIQLPTISFSSPPLLTPRIPSATQTRVFNTSTASIFSTPTPLLSPTPIRSTQSIPVILPSVSPTLLQSIPFILPTPTPIQPLSPIPSLHYLVLEIMYRIEFIGEDTNTLADIDVDSIITAIAARYLNLSTTPDVSVTSINGSISANVDSVTITGISNTNTSNSGFSERTVTFYVVQNATLIAATEAKRILDRSSNQDWMDSIRLEVPGTMLQVINVTIRLYSSSVPIPTDVLTTQSIAPVNTTIVPTQSLTPAILPTVSMLSSRLQSTTSSVIRVFPTVPVSQPSLILPSMITTQPTVSSRIVPVIPTFVTSLITPGLLVSTTQTMQASISTQSFRQSRLASSSIFSVPTPRTIFLSPSSLATQTTPPTPSLSSSLSSLLTTQTLVPMPGPSSAFGVRSIFPMPSSSIGSITTQSVLPVATPSVVFVTQTAVLTSISSSSFTFPMPSSSVPFPMPSTSVAIPIPSSSVPFPISSSSVPFPISSSSVPFPIPSSSVPFPIPSSSVTFPISSSSVPFPMPSTSVAIPIPSSSVTFPISSSSVPFPMPSTSVAIPIPSSSVPFPISSSSVPFPISSSSVPFPMPSSSTFTGQSILQTPTPSSTFVAATTTTIPSSSSSVSQSIRTVIRSIVSSQTILPMISPSSSVLQTTLPPSSTFSPLTIIPISTPSSFISQPSSRVMTSPISIPPSNISQTSSIPSTSFLAPLSSQVPAVSTQTVLSMSSLLNQTLNTSQVVETSTQSVSSTPSPTMSTQTPLISIPTTSLISPSISPEPPGFEMIPDFDPGVGYLLLLTISPSGANQTDSLVYLTTELQLINLYSVAEGIETNVTSRRKRDVYNTTSMLAAGIVESRSQINSNPLRIVFYISQGEAGRPHRYIPANESVEIYNRLTDKQYNSIFVNYSFVSIEIYSEPLLFQPMTAVIVGSILGCCILLLLVFLVSIILYYCLHSASVRSDKWSPEKAIAFTNEGASSEFDLKPVYEKDWATEGTQTLARDFLSHATTDFIYSGDELRSEAMIFSPFQTDDSLVPGREEDVTPSEEGVAAETYLYQSRVDATLTKQSDTISQLRSVVEDERRRAERAEADLLQIMASNRRQSLPAKGGLFSDPDEVRRAEERASTVYEKSKREMLSATDRPSSAGLENGQESSRYRRPRSGRVAPSTEPPDDDTASRLAPQPKILDWSADTVDESSQTKLVSLTGFRSVKQPVFLPVKPVTIPRPLSPPPVLKRVPSHQTTSDIPLQTIPVRIVRTDGAQPFQTQVSSLYPANGNTVPVTTIKVLPSFNPFYTSARKDNTQL